MDPGSLELELTESVLMKRLGVYDSCPPESCGKQVWALPSDDFGTGYPA